MRVEVLLAGTTAPEPLPVEPLVEADLWQQLPADLPYLLTLLPRADLYLQDEVQFAFHPTLTRRLSPQGSTGRTADVFCDQVRAAVARSKVRGRVAIIIADNLKTHTAQGSLLVRSMLTELSGQLYLVYTPAYDPDANRIEWLWRISRRIVTHNHHRKDFESLLADAKTHFETLSQTPDDLLRHIGSPFAPDNRSTRLQALAA